MDCASVIVTYYPDPSSIRNIVLISNLCNKVFVVDNTPRADCIPLAGIKNIEVLTLGKNIGVSAALNKGILRAGKDGFENIFLFDQDSRVEETYFREMLRFKAKLENIDADFALYVPNFLDRNTGSYARFPLLSGLKVKHTDCMKSGSSRGKFRIVAITSGSLLSYEKYLRIGPMREDYFIDFVDNEYCLRLQKIGLNIALNCDVLLDHAIGRRSVHKFLGLTLKPNDHEPVRRYYIARNGVKTAVDYLTTYPAYAELMVARMVHEILSILVYERDKLRKTSAIVLGWYHGLIGRMGKCQVGFLLDKSR